MIESSSSNNQINVIGGGTSQSGCGFSPISHTTVIPLTYTPRKIAILPRTGAIAVIETDQGVLTPHEKEVVRVAARSNALSSINKSVMIKDEEVGVMDVQIQIE